MNAISSNRDARKATRALFIFFLTIANISAANNAAQIANVYNSVNGKQTKDAGLGDWLTVEISALSPEQQAFSKANESKLTLYLGDIPIKGLCTDLCIATNSGNAVLRFYLQRTEATRADWAALLGRPNLSNFTRPLLVSVGIDDDYKLPAVSDDAARINFVVMREGCFWGCVIFSGFLIYGVYILAKRTNALRDDGPPPPAGELRTYSLARCQMAFWFVLVVPTFIYLWLITGALDTLTPSILVLMGVSAGTAVFAHSIGAQGGTTPVSTGLIKGFVNDALKDDNGSISFHHFQMFVWTVVLGCIFIAQVWSSLTMPEFSDTLLGLMGISSGTYLGFMLK